MTLEHLHHILDESRDEDEFAYKGQHYFYSRCMGDPDKIWIAGPENEEYVDSVDEVLDKLLVDGKPLREMLGHIEDW